MRSVLPSCFAVAGVLGASALSGCANDPLYIPGPMTMEAGVDMMGMRSEARAQLQLPIKTETAEDRAARDAMAARLTPVEVPYVRVGGIEVEVEWTIRNLDTTPGVARIQLNGANEYFSYDPALIVFDPDDEEAPPTPGLRGDIPIDVEAGATVSGLFTEDDLREASIDLDQITRGNLNPFRASLTISKNAKDFQPLTAPMPTVEDYEQTPTGPAVPREAFAQMTRIDLVFKPNRHMVLEYNVRVRDLRGILHDLLLTAETERPDELQAFEPMAYEIAAPMPPAP